MEKNAEEDIGHSDETVIFSVFTEGIRILCANQFLYTVASSLQKNSSDIFVPPPTYLLVKVNSVQEACAKCFAVHILIFEILQIT